MKRGIWIALLAAVAFAAILLARMPAAWVIPAGSAQGSCASVDGSLWSGVCTGLTVQRTPVGDVSWELHPLRLLFGKLAAHIAVTRGAANLNAEVEFGLGQRVTMRDLVADVPLDPALIPGLAADLHGRAHLDLALAQIEHGIITQLQGRIEAHDLEDRSGMATPLGSYVVTFPGGSGEPTGKLRDLDGPLAVEGTLRLTREPGFDLEGLVAPRSGATPELVNNIRYLGSPDASGRRPFSLAGTF
ncbi:MAG TPA: type II secretion system protein N [Steroidobacteraceae bacterium]